MALGVDNLGLERLLLLTSESMANSGRRSNKSVAMARPFLPSSMAENFSFRGHETRTYLCACHLGFLDYKIINICKNIRLKPFNQEVLQKKTLTYHHEIACKP
jgi:hypothetical protein